MTHAIDHTAGKPGRDVAGQFVPDAERWWPATYYAQGQRWLEQIAEDHSFTFRTPFQRHDPACSLPYGPRGAA